MCVRATAFKASKHMKPQTRTNPTTWPTLLNMYALWLFVFGSFESCTTDTDRQAGRTQGSIISRRDSSTDCSCHVCCLLACRDQSPSFTAVRTAGLSGEVPSSPTSPRVKPPGSLFGGNSNSPLLKAALNANLARINAQQQRQQQQQVLSANGARSPAAGALNAGMLSASGAYAGEFAANAGQSGISSNVKQRLKEYFVARNTELIPSAAAAAGAGGYASSDNGYSHSQHQAMPMQH